MNEKWKDIIGYEGLYEISNLGRVRTVRNGRIRKTAVQKSGFAYVTLSKDGKLRTESLARAVWRAFKGEPGDLIVAHKNFDRLDDRLENLVLRTYSDHAVAMLPHVILQQEMAKNGKAVA